MFEELTAFSLHSYLKNPFRLSRDTIIVGDLSPSNVIDVNHLQRMNLGFGTSLMGQQMVHFFLISMFESYRSEEI